MTAIQSALHPNSSFPSSADDAASRPGSSASASVSGASEASLVSTQAPNQSQLPHGEAPATVTSEGSDVLVKSYCGGKSSAAQYIAANTEGGLSSSSARRTNNSSAERTAHTELGLGHADAGITSARDAAYAEAALMKGKQGSLEADIVGASVKLGTQTEVAATVAKIGISNDAGDQITVETVGGRVGLGIHNTDGSTGLNLGGSASLISGDVRTNFSDGSSFSLNVGAGITYEGSYGQRDADQDGSVEHCAKLGYGAVIVGACIEEDSIQRGKDAVIETAREVSSSVQQWWKRL